MSQAQDAATPSKTFCEFFAGIGLVHEGLIGSGWQCVYANDINLKKREMYTARFGSNHFHLSDVWDTGAVVGRIVGRPFFATASFPCVDLSLAGHCKGLADGRASSTFFGFAKALALLGDRRPALVLLENVMGLISARGGQDFKQVVQTLGGLGYWADAFVLDAARFVPQSRPRVFVVGMAESVIPSGAVRQEPLLGLLAGDAWRDKMSTPSPLRPAQLQRLMEAIDLPTGWVALPLPKPPVRVVELAQVMDLDDEQAWWDAAEVDRHVAMFSERHQAQVAALLAGGGLRVGAGFRRIRQNVQRLEVRFDGLAGCLRTPRGGSAKQILVIVDRGRLRLRWMSPREYARLQGADDFPLVGNRIQQLFGFGDAVCVPAIRWIDQHVLTPIFEAAVRPSSRNGLARQSHA